MVSQEPAKLSYVHAQSGFESRWLRQEQRSTICLVMYSVGKSITPKWRSYARVGNPDAQEAHPVHHARAEDSIFRRFMNNKSSPARGRKRVTQCAGMRIKNSTRIWRGRIAWSSAPVQKTGDPTGSVGSNPTPSANIHTPLTLIISER